jgi:diacylglycerol kinase family enzyme
MYLRSVLENKKHALLFYYLTIQLSTKTKKKCILKSIKMQTRVGTSMYLIQTYKVMRGSAMKLCNRVKLSYGQLCIYVLTSITSAKAINYAREKPYN